MLVVFGFIFRRHLWQKPARAENDNADEEHDSEKPEEAPLPCVRAFAGSDEPNSEINKPSHIVLPRNTL